MAYFLRYTSTKDETRFTSEDQVNKVKFNGLCAYDISEDISEMLESGYEFTQACEILARKQAEFDNWHCHNSKGQYVIFSGRTVGLDRDNQDRHGNRAVIAKLKEYEGYGLLVQQEYGYSCVSFQTVL